jgi:rRNA-processing protein EBP2
MAKGKLKSALDQYRGRNIRLEKQRKKEKAARKRKEQNQPADEESKEDETNTQNKKVVAAEVNGEKTRKPEKAGKSKKSETPEEVEWETEASEEDDDSEDEDDSKIDLSRLEDSDSGGSSDEDMDDDDEEDDDEDEDEEEDIRLSDIESLASEDKGDIIPHQRLTINNTAALTAALNRISLPYSKLTFSEHQSITSDAPTEIPDVEDDLNRELAFYKQSLAAVKDARLKLKQEGVSFSRPADYFAEMVKSDEHMGKIKQKLIDEAAGKKAAAEARRQRDLKKFGKQVQVAKLQERAKEKRDTLEKINLLKRSTTALRNGPCGILTLSF